MRSFIVALVVSLALSSSAAAETPPESNQLRSGAPTVPKLSFTMLGGLAVPTCRGQFGPCDGDLGVGPSLAGLALYAPNDVWAFGLAAQVTRVHWRDPYVGMVDGSTHYLDADLTSGFVAAAGRFIPLPAARVTPVAHFALGTGFQAQTGDNFHCNGGFIPTAHLSVGGRARVADPLAFYLLASGTYGVKMGCGVSDGPSATPYAGWGLGLHAGASYDVGL